jgi:Zn-dependent peptidase ImmA (M78 family)/DNA-binding XRE family transcriptional regulator
MQHFPERLKAARKMQGFSLQDVADALDGRLNKQALNRFETGEAMPDSEILGLLCKVLKVSRDYFFREALLNLEHIEFRKLKKLPVKEQGRVTSQTAEYLERYLEIEELLGIDNQPAFTPHSFVVKHTADIEQAANELRKLWNLGDDGLHNVLELLEDHHIKICPLEADPSFSGMSTLVENKIAVIVLNTHPGIPVVRRRFTALHELAHLYLQLDGYDEKEAEKKCDHFAGALLLPEHRLRQYFGNKRTRVFTKELVMIAGQYGISLAAIMYRALNLGIISAAYHRFFMVNYNKFNTREKEFTVYAGIEKNERFLQLLISAVANEVISTSKAAVLYNQKLGDFRKILDSAVP